MMQKAEKKPDILGVLAGLALIAVVLISPKATSSNVLPYLHIAFGLLVYFVTLGLIRGAFGENKVGGILLLLMLVATCGEVVAELASGLHLRRPADGFRIFQFVAWIGFILALVAAAISDASRARKIA
ncbi:MAG: hypothetical protein Q7R90_04450 [bacterium]|nr:hypothetical protein [bacterium]